MLIGGWENKGADKWNELLEFLAKLGNSQREEHRVQSMIIFSNLLQNLAEDLEVFYSQFASIFAKGFVDSSFQVRIAAMTGASHLLSYDDSFSSHFKEFLPQMIEVFLLPPPPYPSTPPFSPYSLLPPYPSHSPNNLNDYK